MNCIQTCYLLLLGCSFAVEINRTNIQNNTTYANATKLMQLVNDIKLYLKKLYELNEYFPEEFVKGKDKIDEIEQDARKMLETINHIRNIWDDEEYKKNMAMICEMSDEKQNIQV
ncbi:hypothetical protein ACH3XW_39320 [Acanthocheilonema viteae]|uniref:Uncharacterized protein n=1 Tax=Acanthocheilonema viteae TaxID=6277 RepID=A0A498SKJ2_ACAVI|nr:unnamed protein product [Acanthocheilonema viteae]